MTERRPSDLGLPNRIILVLGGIGVLLGFSPKNLNAIDQLTAAPRDSTSIEQQKRAVEERDEQIQSLAVRLKGAQGAEERRMIVNQLRSKLEARSKALASGTQSQEAVVQSRFRLLQVGTSPEIVGRLAKMSVHLEAIQKLKSAIDAVGKPDPRDRARLMEEVSKMRSELMNTQEASFAEARAVSTESEARQAPLAMTVLRQESEQWKREIEVLKEALTKATPEERTKLLEEWKAKRQEEMNNQLTKMPR